MSHTYRPFRVLLALLLGALMGTGLLTAGPAQAATGSFTSPTEGSVQPAGFTGPITFTADTSGYYEVALSLMSGDGMDSRNAEVYVDGSLQGQLTLAEPLGGGSWSMSLRDSGGSTLEDVTFDVQIPPVQLSDVSLSRTTFYPTVQDGYQDTTTLRYSLNEQADTWFEVRNSSGTLVRTDTMLTAPAGQNSWTWDGRRNDGSPVGAGTFSVRVTVDGPDGSTASASRKVTATTGWRTKWVTKTRTGDTFSASGHSSGCHIERPGWYGNDVFIDCWGSKYAYVRYGFAVPSNAANLSFTVGGERFCCDGGTFTKVGERTSSTSYRVTVKVTGWRAYDVRRVGITYSTRYRI